MNVPTPRETGAATAASSANLRWSERWALPILVVGILAVGLSPILVRLSELPPAATGANRLIFSSPFFLALLVLQGKHRPAPGWYARKELWLAILGGVFFAADLLTWNWSVMLTSVADATLLANLTPIYVAAASWFLFKVPIQRGFILAMVIAIAGSAVMISERWSISSLGLIGDLAAVAASMSYSGYVLVIARARRRMSTSTTMAISGVVAAIIVSVASLATEPVFWPSTTDGWLVIAGFVVFVQIGGQMLITASLGHVSANFSALLMLIQPIVPVVVAWVLFNERIGVIQALGAAFVLVGLELARRSARHAGGLA